VTVAASRPPHAALGLIAAYLTIVVVAFTLTAEPDTFSGRVWLLAACAAVANIASVYVRSSLAASSSFVLALLAAAFSGPAAGVVVIVLQEAAAWTHARVRGTRYRTVSLFLNIGAQGIPTLFAGLVFTQFLPESRLTFAAALLLVGKQR